MSAHSEKRNQNELEDSDEENSTKFVEIENGEYFQKRIRIPF